MSQAMSPDASRQSFDGSEATVAALEAMLESDDKNQARNDGSEEESETGRDSGAGGDSASDVEKTGRAAAPATGDGEQGEDEEEGEPVAVIAPPKSWPAEMRAQFARLPRDLQGVIAEREAERDAAFNRHVNEAAQRRRAADAELQAASTERRQYLAGLSAVIGELAAQAAGEFADIRTTADLERLAAEDPQRYLRWQARRDALSAAQAEHQGLLERERAEEDRRFQGYLRQQRQLLLEKVPEFADPGKARALQSESADYLREIGFTEQEIGAVVDHRLALVVRDALAHRRSQTAAKTAAEKKVAGVPRLQRPGARSDGKAESGAERRAAMTRIARHGTTDQQALALTRLLEQES